MYLTHSKGVFGVVQTNLYESRISYLVVFILKRCVKYQKYIIILLETSGLWLYTSLSLDLTNWGVMKKWLFVKCLILSISAHTILSFLAILIWYSYCSVKKCTLNVQYKCQYSTIIVGLFYWKPSCGKIPVLNDLCCW